MAAPHAYATATPVYSMSSDAVADKLRQWMTKPVSDSQLLALVHVRNRVGAGRWLLCVGAACSVVGPPVNGVLQALALLEANGAQASQRYADVMLAVKAQVEHRRSVGVYIPAWALSVSLSSKPGAVTQSLALLSEYHATLHASPRIVSQAKTIARPFRDREGSSLRWPVSLGAGTVEAGPKYGDPAWSRSGAGIAYAGPASQDTAGVLLPATGMAEVWRGPSSVCSPLDLATLEQLHRERDAAVVKTYIQQLHEQAEAAADEVRCAVLGRRALSLLADRVAWLLRCVCCACALCVRRAFHVRAGHQAAVAHSSQGGAPVRRPARPAPRRRRSSRRAVPATRHRHACRHRLRRRARRRAGVRRGWPHPYGGRRHQRRPPCPQRRRRGHRGRRGDRPWRRHRVACAQAPAAPAHDAGARNRAAGGGGGRAAEEPAAGLPAGHRGALPRREGPPPPPRQHHGPAGEGVQDPPGELPEGEGEAGVAPRARPHQGVARRQVRRVQEAGGDHQEQAPAASAGPNRQVPRRYRCVRRELFSPPVCSLTSPLTCVRVYVARCAQASSCRRSKTLPWTPAAR